MAQEVLPVLLAHVHDVVPVLRDTRPAREILRIREEIPPLRREQVHDVEVLSLGFRMAALGREEMYV